MPLEQRSRRRARAPRPRRARAARRRARTPARSASPVGMQQLAARAEARGRPAVLRVVGAAAVAERVSPPAVRRRAPSRRAPAGAPRTRPRARRRSAGRDRAPRASRASGAGARPTRSACSPRPRRAATRRSTHDSHSAYEANAGGAPARGSSASTGARFDAMPVSSPANHGEFAESASTTGSHGHDRLEAAPALLGRRHADVHVQPLHALAPDGDAAVADERHVALLLDDRLRLGQRERMRRGRGDREALAPRRRPRPPRRSAGSAASTSATVVADVGVRLEDRREELGLQPPRQLAALDALRGSGRPPRPARASPRRGSSAPPRRRARTAARLAEVLLDHVRRERRAPAARPRPRRSTTRSGRTRSGSR